MELNRRRFFQALAASVVAVGAPLPIGFPRLRQNEPAELEPEYEVQWRRYDTEWQSLDQSLTEYNRSATNGVVLHFKLKEINYV